MKAKRTSSVAAISIINQNLQSDLSRIAADFKKSLLFFSTTRVASFDTSEIKSKILRLFSTNGRNDNNKVKKALPFIILGIVLLGVIILTTRFIQSTFAGQQNSTTDGRIELKEARGKMILDKNYEFPILDDKGKEVTKLKFLLNTAELRDEIILKGEKVTLLKGSTYLVVTIKLTNKSDKFINMKVRNYVRLGLNNNNEDWAAADVYNDPVEVQPFSTKQTRLAFPISENDTNWILKVGDLNGKKEDIPLKFN